MFCLKAFKACFCGINCAQQIGKKKVLIENDILDVLVNIAKGGVPLHHLNSVLKNNNMKEFKLFNKENSKGFTNYK
jgi:hypothetical protein